MIKKKKNNLQSNRKPEQKKFIRSNVKLVSGT